MAVQISKHIYEKYMRLLVTDNTLEVQHDKIVYRCFMCGDSKNDPSKKRGALLIFEGGAFFSCMNHGCRAEAKSIPFTSYMRSERPGLYDAFKRDVIGSRGGRRIVNTIELPKSAPKPSRPIIKNNSFVSVISDIDPNLQEKSHKFISDRKIPSFYANKMMYAYEGDMYGRIIIPYGNTGYYVARDLLGVGEKYKTPYGINRPIFGMDRVDASKTIYVLEGEIDSMFIENSISVGSVGNADMAIDAFPNSSLVFVFDNDPSGISAMFDLVVRGYSVIRWPTSVTCKDINEAVVSGMVPLDGEYVSKEYLESNTLKSTVKSILGYKIKMNRLNNQLVTLK